MNKRGQVVFIMLMLGVVLFVLALAFAPELINTIDESLDDPMLNCSTTTDAQTKAVCSSMEANKLYVGIVFGLAGVLLVGVIIR